MLQACSPKHLGDRFAAEEMERRKKSNECVITLPWRLPCADGTHALAALRSNYESE